MFKALKTALDPEDDEKTPSPNTMTPKEIVAKFANLLKHFDLIDGKPSDTNLKRIREVVDPLLLQILYNETGAVHNLVGLVWSEAAYATRYGAAFLEPTRVGAYNA